MRVFQQLRALRRFERQQLDFFSTLEDHFLIGEIGHHQAAGNPLTLKQVFLLDVGSVATVQRRLRRLRTLGLIQQHRSPDDKRAVVLTLTPKCQRALAKYEDLLPERRGRRNGMHNEARLHVCGLYRHGAEAARLLDTFVSAGLQRGDHCVVVAPAASHEAVGARLALRARRATDRRAPGKLTLSAGARNVEEQMALIGSWAAEARSQHRRLRIAADATWALEHGLGSAEMIDFEKRVDVLLRQHPMQCLCLYDAGRYPGGVLLEAIHAHRDSAKYPLVLP